MSTPAYELETEDGCTWSISWFREASAFFVDVWTWEPDTELDATADPEPDCTCPFPVLGIYDSLDTIELAMGMKIPPGIRDRLLLDAQLEPTTDTERAEWNRVWAAEVYRVAPDGEIVASFVPALTDDPNSPRWDPDNSRCDQDRRTVHVAWTRSPGSSGG